ncbi:MAG: hypothetical protein JWQ50_6806 [Caballeronia mineralivorans]|nr:hypothetical protein [Caballeronia mineralivorans]
MSASYDMIVNSRAFSTCTSLLLTSRTFDGSQFNWHDVFHWTCIFLFHLLSGPRHNLLD